MSKKKHSPHPVPTGNRTTFGPETDGPAEDPAEAGAPTESGASFSEQDPKRRLGGYETAGEHSIVQPGGKNDAQRGAGGK
jgi:hypothetical protein